jgi:hypothetical protein
MVLAGLFIMDPQSTSPLDTVRPEEVNLGPRFGAAIGLALGWGAGTTVAKAIWNIGPKSSMPFYIYDAHDLAHARNTIPPFVKLEWRARIVCALGLAILGWFIGDKVSQRS